MLCLPDLSQIWFNISYGKNAYLKARQMPFYLTNKSVEGEEKGG